MEQKHQRGRKKINNPFIEEGFHDTHDGRMSVLTKISMKMQIPHFYMSDSESFVVIHESIQQPIIIY